MKSQNNIIWIDLEMTGLDCFNDSILEIATVITNSELKKIAEGPTIAIYHDQETLDQMDSWNQNQHKKSGLIKRVLESNITTKEAQSQTIDFLSNYINKGISPMAGNSICQDRRFLARQMPELEKWFHYRNLDVSSIKELAKRWYPNLKPYQKQSTHLALDDIYDSIAELEYYRQHLFTSP